MGNSAWQWALALGSAAVLLGTANVATAAEIFTGSVSGAFGQFDPDLGSGVPPTLDTGTISFVFEGMDLNGNGEFVFFSPGDSPFEFQSLTLTSSGFATPEFNFTLFVDLEAFINPAASDANALLLPELGSLTFDFTTSTIAVQLDSLPASGPEFLAIDQNSSQDQTAIAAADLNGDGDADDLGETISTIVVREVPEPLTLAGTLAALSGGVVLRNKRVTKEQQA